MASWEEIRNGIFAGESGGDPNALYGYANRPGGRFAGVNVSDMSVADVMAFTDPRGEYAQHVKGQIGRVATPVGNFQVVGSTLRDAVKGMGLTGTEKFDAATQDAIGQWIYSQQGTGAWEGYKGPQSGGTPMMGLLSTGMPEQPQTFGQRIKSGFQDGSLFDSMAMAFNGLRMNPDENLGQVVGRRQEMRQQDDVMNRTVAWLQSMGTPQALQAAQALATGSIDAGSAVQYALKEAPSPGVNVVDGKLISDTGEVLYGPTMDGTQPLSDDALSNLNTLRDDVRSETSNFSIVQNGWKNLEAFYSNPGAVSDYALAVAFAKIVDPGSVAREGEVAAVASAGAKFPAYAQSLKNAFDGKGNMLPQMRQEIATLAREMYINSATQAQATIDNFKSLAERAGLPPEYVYMGNQISMPGPIKPPASPPPPPVQGPPPPSSTFIPAGG
jgi:hypothetical protein